jgi:hypothetical protein
MDDTKSARTMSASVPLDTSAGGIDTSALSQAIQSIIAENTPTEKRVNPATYIHESGIRMVELYGVYEKLRAIGSQLNGKLTSDPLPDTLQIENITINFRTVDGETVSDTQSVALTHLTTVGDLSNLLATELGAVIVLLQRETDAVLDIATRTKDMCAKSRKAWEESNKDKKILEETIDGAAETIAETVQSVLNESGPPTLDNTNRDATISATATAPVLTAYTDK